MNSLQLLNSTFKRICAFVEKSGFKIRNIEYGIAFYFYPDSKLLNYTWIWKNKKEMLLGRRINDYDDIESSLFSLSISRYNYFKRHNIKNSEPLSEPISKNTLNFINVCSFLKSCDSVEELAIKMDLMGV
jgi:hypothetical protein